MRAGQGSIQRHARTSVCVKSLPLKSNGKFMFLASDRGRVRDGSPKGVMRKRRQSQSRYAIASAEGTTLIRRALWQNRKSLEFSKHCSTPGMTLLPEPSTDSFVTGDQIVEAIKACGSSLSPRNPPNFLKDFIRKESGNTNWPSSIIAKGYTARQHYGTTGTGHVFEFISYKPGQTVPFPDPYSTDDIETVHLIESISLPSAARAMGRKDEAWLIQACVHQRLVENTFRSLLTFGRGGYFPSSK